MSATRPSLLLLLAATLFASPAVADTSKKAAAEALFQAARDLVLAGNLVGACEKFEASQRLDPALGTLLHLGDCYERTERTASAWAAFEEAASLAQIEGQRQREEIARTRAAALEPRLSRVEVRVAEKIPGLRIEIADVSVPAASWGMAIPVDPGMQLVRATAPGHRSWSKKVRIGSEGNVQVVEVPVLPPERDETPSPIVKREKVAEAPVEAPRDRGAPQRIAGITLGAAGLAGLTAGGVLGIQAMLDNDHSRSLCRPDDASLCRPDGVAMRQQAKDFALGSTIAFAAGGALLATGVTLFFTAEDGERSLRASVSPERLTIGGAW